MNKLYAGICALLLILLFISPARITAVEPTGFHFLQTNVGARQSALAGAAVAHTGDLHALYYNPAGLATIEGRVGSVTYLKHLIDFQSGFVGYAQSLKQNSVFALGINYIDYGEFDETDSQGEKLGTTFNANTMVLTASYARQAVIENMFVGVSAKYIRSVIQSFSSTAAAVDVGVIYRVPFTEDLDIGLSVLNIGNTMSAFIEEKSKLPQKIVAGFSKQLAHLPLLFNLNGYKVSNDEDFQFVVGGELNVATGVFLRFGFDSIGRDAHVNSDLDKLAGVSAGFGFNRNEYHLDYAISSLGEVGSLNRVSFTYIF
ncbi:PorV/PorQ family protein [candidate division KSB1 bacterium]|nr:PorV/PorQ family protein [candidate division KSB1 bacterium]